LHGQDTQHFRLVAHRVFSFLSLGRGSCDHIVVRFTSTYAIRALYR